MPCKWCCAEVGTNNIISKAQRNKAQRSFQPVKAQRKMRNLILLLSEAQRNFRNELFDSVEAQRNSAIAERYFRTKLKRNLTSAIEISQHNANTAFLNWKRTAILNWKRVNNLLNKPKIYQYYDGNGAKLSLMYRIALLIEKNFWKRNALKAQQILKALFRKATSAMFQNKKLKRNATYAIVEVAEVALCASNCALPTSGVMH